MLVLITYDVETVTRSGQKRLRAVAKCCQDYGQRVQNSVFECVLSECQAVKLKADLSEIIDLEKDSIRIYYLGNNYISKVDQLGKKTSYDASGDLII
jgi:CRISPR-associated protein Cas2